jgi:Tfp pilus assembly protein PilZ
MDFKSDLKNIISEQLVKVASSFFIDKSLSIIDQSADNKESFLAATERISKRIALFIDTDLASKVYDILRLEIDNRELSPGTRRKHLRVDLCHRVYVTYNGTPYELYTGNISEGGVFIKTNEPFPAGSKVDISLPMEAGSHIHLRGIVVSVKLPPSGIPGHQTGMGIKFEEIGDDELKILRDFVKRVSAQDFLDSQKSAIKPTLAGNQNTIS